MNKKYMLGAIIAVIAIGVIGTVIYTKSITTPKSDQEPVAQKNMPAKKLEVTASFYPLYFFATQVGGDKAHVSNVVPAGGEPHEYEPTPQNVAQIQKSDILFLNGANLEGWASDVEKNTEGTQTKIVTVGEGLTNLQVEEEGEMVIDPHIWLSPTIAEKIIDKMSSAMQEKDPANASYYQANTAELKTKLTKLHADYTKGLSSCARKDIIASHSAYGYLAADFGLKQVPIAGLSPEEEPSAQELAEVAAFAKKNNVTHIFFETLVSPKLAEIVANEIGAKTLVLDPIEGIAPEDIQKGKNYITIMYENLTNLKLALACTS